MPVFIFINIEPSAESFHFLCLGAVMCLQKIISADPTIKEREELKSREEVGTSYNMSVRLWNFKDGGS